MRRILPILTIAFLAGFARAEVPATDGYDSTKSDLKMLEQAGIADEAPALLKFFQQRTVSEPDRVKIGHIIQKLGDDSFDTREAAMDQIEQFGIAAIGLLRQAGREEDYEVVRRCELALARIEKVPSQALTSAAARRLAVHKADGTAEALLAYLPMADDDSVSEEVRNALAAVATVDKKPNKALLQALSDPLVIRRGAAAEALVRSGPAELLPQLIAQFRREKDADTRIRLAVALVTGAKQKDLVPDLIDLMSQVPLDLGWQAEDVMCRLAGEDKGPKVTLGNDQASRTKARDAWAEWWKANEKGVDLAKLEERAKMLGYTMILEMDVRGITGRVVELGPDNKERWKVENVQFPIAAQLLNGNRLLLAEHNRHTISERDITTGKIIWTQQVLMPVAVQRLPNGHTFVAARNQLVEFDAERKQVYSYPRPQHDIVAAQKLRNGEIIYATNGGQLVRLNAKREEVKSFSVGRVNYYSGLQALSNNRVLVTQLNSVAEFDLESGQSRWTANVNTPTSVQRLPNGNTLVASMNSMKVIELDSAGKEVWTYTPNGARPWRAMRR